MCFDTVLCEKYLFEPHIFMKQFSTLVLLFALLLVAPTVNASESTQDQSQKTEVECTTSGSYGQDTSCKTKTEQNQKTIIRNGKVLAAHTPVNTSIPTEALAVLAGFAAVSTVVSLKNIKN